MIRRNARRISDRAVQFWMQGRNAVVLSGPGYGLRFHSGPARAPYALGRIERPVQEALAASLRPGDVFYDIGANVGFFSVLGARLVGSVGTVYAFEPVPENASSVRHNAAINDFAQVTVMEQAVSEIDGIGRLIVAHHAGGATLADVGKPPDPRDVVTVDLVAVDTLVTAGILKPPNVVKIDVEGAEENVLRGMTQTLSDHRPIVILEVDDGDRSEFERKQQACCDLLKAHDYTLQPLDDSYSDIEWLVWHVVATPRL